MVSGAIPTALCAPSSEDLNQEKPLYAIFIGKDSLVWEVPKTTPRFGYLLGDPRDSAHSYPHAYHLLLPDDTKSSQQREKPQEAVSRGK